MADRTRDRSLQLQDLLLLSRGRAVAVGADRYMTKLGLDVSAFASEAQRLGEQGKTPLYAAVDGRFFNKDDATNNYSSKAIVPDPINSLGYKEIAELMFIGGKNIDALVPDVQSGNPTFNTKTTLTTHFTNAAGGINTKFGSGALMVIDDHVNFLGSNPLIFPDAATKSRLKVWGDVSAEDQAYFDEEFSAIVEGVGA